MSSAYSTATSDRSSGLSGLLKRLNSIQVGGPKHGNPHKIKPAKLAEILQLLLMLLQNGLSLPKALGSLSSDRSSRRHSLLLMYLKRTIEAGGSLSDGMANFPKTFTPMQVQQIRMGQRSGSLEQSLARVAEQLHRGVVLRKRIIKKISYPILITVAGSGLMVFMCLVVVPEFEKVYGDSGVKLPIVTRVVTATSRTMIRYGWLMLPIVGFLAGGWILARKRPKASRLIDRFLLRIPIIGPWLRDIAVLQFAEGISSMVQCGYTPVEAVEVASDCVSNASVRAATSAIRDGLRRGERLSDLISAEDHLFSATLAQLIAVGEKSGHFERSMRGVCDHLRERLETRIDASVGMIEPVLTISLAAMIGGIVLSIYTPMFHMFEVLE